MVQNSNQLIIFFVAVLSGYAFGKAVGKEGDVQWTYIEEEQPGTVKYMSACLKPGFICSDCQSLYFCRNDGNGTLKPTMLQTCSNAEGFYCNVAAGGCSTNKRDCDIFGLQEIKCQAEGNFPDPYDCTSYHRCTTLDDGSMKSTRYECPLGKAYDSFANNCRFKLTDRVCVDSPVPKCKKALRTGSLIENPSIYFVCVMEKDGLRPRLYKCEDGKVYDAKSYQCVDPNTVTLSLGGTVSANNVKNPKTMFNRNSLPAQKTPPKAWLSPLSLEVIRE